jgi:hypothetical protein
VGSLSSSEPNRTGAGEASPLPRHSENRTRIWHGTTPSGYPLLIERDDRNRWVATIANASRSRNTHSKQQSSKQPATPSVANGPNTSQPQSSHAASPRHHERAHVEPATTTTWPAERGRRCASGTSAALAVYKREMRSLLLLVGLVPLLALAGVAAANARPQISVRTGASGTTCTASAAKMLVRTFVRRYDTGDVAAAMHLWAPEPFFQWFSTGPPGARLGASAYQRDTLAGYLRARVHAHERLLVLDLHAGLDPQRSIVNFAGKLVRSAADLSAARRHDFKGATGCVRGRPMLIVWSM